MHFLLLSSWNYSSSGETQILPLETPLPVYMLYWTAIAISDRVMAFPADRYGRDEALIKALRTPSPGDNLEVAFAPQ